MDPFPYTHTIETLLASEMGEKDEHSGWTKLRNSRLHIYVQLVKTPGSVGIYIHI